jgi:hypothetical protein
VIKKRTRPLSSSNITRRNAAVRAARAREAREAALAAQVWRALTTPAGGPKGAR